MKTCQSCNKQYSQTSLQQCAETLNTTTLEWEQNYPNLCLSCIRTNLNQVKQSYIPSLTQAKTTLDQARSALNQADLIYQQLTTKFRHLDRQAAFIKHFLTKPTPSTTTTKSIKQKPISTEQQVALINAILSKLTPEQQTAIKNKLS